MSWTPAEQKLTPQWRSREDGGWGGGRPSYRHQRLSHLEVRQLAVGIALLDIHRWYIGWEDFQCTTVISYQVLNCDTVGG